PSLWYQNGVGHRHIRGRVAVEDELCLDHPVVHLRRGFLRPRAKNSVNACATRAEIVLPDSLACSRTRTASAAGNLTVNTVVSSGTMARPPSAARSAYRRACRTEQPNRSARMGAASATGTPDSSSSAAALTRWAYTAAPARARPSDMT
ncbi:hypothetical protein, partial [Rhodococcus erythropolis]|uniref:hypothetical protein n=1 Tax=Rhodococcus erythropolis TaxID=1833 RepID=UPI001FD7E212